MTELSVDEARAVFNQVTLAVVAAPEEVGEIVDRHATVGDLRVPLRVYRPRSSSSPVPALVYLHGGGWVVGNLDSHDGVCRALARRAGCTVVSVDYRLAPEHPFPAAVDDAWAATTWVADSADELGIDPQKIAVGGDSAGGNLAAAVATLARDHDVPLCLQLLVYPVLEFSFDRPSYAENATGFGLTAAAMRWYWDKYLADDGDGASPLASPLRAPALANVAPAHVITVEFDPLRDEGEAYAGRLREAGVAVSTRRFEGLIHGVLRMTAVIPRSYELLDDAAAALSAAFGR